MLHLIRIKHKSNREISSDDPVNRVNIQQFYVKSLLASQDLAEMDNFKDSEILISEQIIP